MWHGTQALLTRSLRLEARQRRAHGVRIGTVGLMFVMLIVAHVTGFALGAPGLRFFEQICFLDFSLITLMGCSYFATAVTEEKEEGTLGLLMMANLSPVAILLGKSTSRLVFALMLFVGQFPFALLSMTLGGVTLRQVVAAYLALAAYICLVANVALLFSVVCRRSGTAGGIVFMLALLSLLGPAAGNSALTELASRNFISAQAGWVIDLVKCLDSLEQFSIVTRLQTILATGFSEALISSQVVVSGLLAIGSFCLSWLLFTPFNTYSEAPPPPRGFVPRSSIRRGFLVQRPWRWPLVWKDFHFVAGGPIVALAKLAAYPLVTALVLRNGDAVLLLFPAFRTAPQAALGFALGMGVVELVLCATIMFHTECKWGTLPTLVLLPRNTWSVMFAKAMGCLAGSLPTWLAIAGVYTLYSREIGTFRQLLLADPVAVPLIVAFAVLLHLTVLYTLIVRWGALPLAIATLILLGTFLSPFLLVARLSISAARHADYVQLGPVLYVGGLVIGALQILITLRMQTTAAMSTA